MDTGEDDRSALKAASAMTKRTGVSEAPFWLESRHLVDMFIVSSAVVSLEVRFTRHGQLGYLLDWVLASKVKGSCVRLTQGTRYPRKG